MALPSQVARPTTGRLATGLSRPRNRAGGLLRPLIVLAVLGLAGGGVWALWNARGGAKSFTDKPQQSATSSTKNAKKTAAAGTGMGPGVNRLADLAKGLPETEAKTPPIVMGTRPTPPADITPAQPSLAASDAMKAPNTVPPPAETPKTITGSPATTTPTTTTSAPIDAPRSNGVQSLMDQGDSAMARNALIEARDFYNRAFFNPGATTADQNLLRGKLSAISEKVTFSPIATPSDPMASTYEIAGGDNLNRISREQDLKVDWRFIQRINQISDPRRIRVGQKIKLLKGPFHVVVDKSDFRMDLFADAKDSAGNHLYLRSFPVGLGTEGSTPLGHWIVRPQSKLVDPAWVNPRTGESFTAEDPMNPIGERWVGIDGIDDSNRDKVGFGIHGTIAPESIGKEMSMGCVRMDAPDIELVYELLVENGTQIEIKP